MDYYRVLDKLSIKNRWFLGKIYSKNKKANVYDYCTVHNKILKEKIIVDISHKGDALDFTMSFFDVPIINERTAQLFSLDEVELIPVKVNDSNENYFVLLIRQEVDCVDEEKSGFNLWEPNNKIRPDLAGKYKSFYKMVLDPKKTNGIRIFRIKDYSIVLVVDKDIKKKLQQAKVSGIEFKKLT
ncbi:imm11 family protein [Emticicia sp. BO119]|uniref:imm11 family protein n=1 Tax=Emticicia sp. BO119 TaxID=2757768 RepID=UPI0015F049B5|nr:DUF1629 domain-containing protein [Emticicia sp. BO119]MBA4852872.1 hypothetical protein [Emticicia sp. BO119]